MARNYAALPHEYLEEWAGLSDAEVGRLCRALLKYSITGEEERQGGSEKVLLKRVYMQERRFQQSYEATIKAKSEAGKKGASRRWQTMADDSTAMADDGKNGKTETKTETNIKTNYNNPPLSPLQGETGFNKELQEAFLDWLAYKKEKRQGYKPTGLKNLIGEIRHNAQIYGEAEVSRVIRISMSSNWQGIAFDKLRFAKPEKEQVPMGCGEMGQAELDAIKKLMQEG